MAKYIVALGSTGDGKSKLGCVLTGGNNFVVSNSAHSETKETIGKAATFRNLPIFFIDTPGLNDSDGMDAEHVKKMVTYLKSCPVGIDAVIIVLNAQNPRLSSAVKKMFNLFCYIFKSDQFVNNVCFVFTHSFDLTQNEKNEKTKSSSDVMKSIITNTGLSVANVNMIPAFFVDNDEPNEQDTSTEFDNLKNWIGSRITLRKDLLQHADPHYKKVEEEFQQIVERTTSEPIIATRQVAYNVQVPHQKWAGDFGKIFGKKKTVYRTETRYRAEQYQSGTKTTSYHAKQKRLKKITYNEQVIYTNWETIQTWTTTA